MNNYESNYRSLVRHILENGEVKAGRNGETKSVFCAVLAVDLLDGFPLLTGRKMFTKGIIGELAAFVRGCELLADYKYLGCNYWDENAKAWDVNAFAGPDDITIGQYVGPLWRDFRAADEGPSDPRTARDQLYTLIEQLKSNPASRRHVLSAWHPAAEAAIPPCTVMAIFNVSRGKLNCHVTQRSADTMLGVPSDVAQYALLTHLLAREAKLMPGQLVFTLVDAHIYSAHYEAAEEYLKRKSHPLPQLLLHSSARPLTFTGDDMSLYGYAHEAPLNFEFVV